MSFFDRAKAILFNPKPEWTVIEAENAPHAKVFFGYLLILALIPALSIFITDWWQWHSITKNFGLFSSAINDNSPYLKFIIAMAVQPLIIILGGAYITAAVINAFSDQFGSEKNFNRVFSLVAYSYTPLCVAGILYLYSTSKSVMSGWQNFQLFNSPFAILIPLIGCYGLYLLYLGIEPQLKPAADKKNVCVIFSLIAVIAVLVLLYKIVPTISQSILMEQVKSNANDAFRNMYPR